MVFKQERFTNDFGRISDSVLEETLEHMKDHPLYLFLPATYSDATNGEVIENIFNTLENIQNEHNSIDNIVLGLDATPEKEQFEEVRERFKEIPNSTIIWNDSPEMQDLYRKLKEQNIPVKKGKGRNMWTGLGHRYMLDRNSSFVIHDCDIRPQYKTGEKIYDDNIFLSMITPLLHPSFGEQDFNKAYYTRLKEEKRGEFRLSGRVTRLLVYPFIDAVKENYRSTSEWTNKKIVDYMDHLKSFKYPLSGEFAMRANLANNLTIQPDWGLEIGTLNSLFQTRYHLSQVDLGNYDHKHARLPDLGNMAEEIVKTVFRKLYSLAEEEAKNTKLFDKTIADYDKFGHEFVNTYRILSASKDWNYDEREEIQAIYTFMDSIKDAHEKFMEQPEEVQPLPNWNQISHKYRKELIDNVEKYN